MQDAPTFVADLATVVGVAAVTGMGARALGQPRILGYLFAGLIVGPSIPIPLFADPPRIQALAEFGVVLVMFAIGLEFRVARLLRVLPTSGFTAIVQLATLMWAGFTVGTLLGWSALGATFLGACLAISSTMVVSGIFRQRPVDADVKEHVLGVLVVQDIVAIVLIAMMSALAAGQDLAPRELAALVARLAGMLIGMLALGMLVVPRLVRHALAAGSTEGIAVLSVGLAFAFALVAQSFGYSIALGAFVAGVLVAESGRGAEVEHAIEPLRAVFAAIFFVSIGMSVDPRIGLANLHIAALVAAVVVVAQLLSVSGASVLSGSPLRRGLLSGLALGQIGEFSFILATIGTGAGVVPAELLPTLVLVATITSFTTPLLLGRGDAIVGRLDRWIPDRVQRLLTVHHGWVERVRSGGAHGASIRRSMRALIVDGLALVVLAAATLALQEPLADRIRDPLGLHAWAAILLVDIACVALAVPLFIGLFRNARIVAMLSARAISAQVDTTSPGGPTSHRFLEALVHLVLVIGVGLPALAVLRPLVRGPWGEPLLLLGMLAALAAAWRNLGRLDDQLQSGVEELARQLSRHAGVEDESVETASLLPGLDRVLALTLADDAFAVGKTLAELDLRARSGATVVAIHKPDAQVIMPTGHERLQPRDVLALAGEPEAIERAQALIAMGTTAASPAAQAP